MPLFVCPNCGKQQILPLALCEWMLDTLLAPRHDADNNPAYTLKCPECTPLKIEVIERCLLDQDVEVIVKPRAKWSKTMAKTKPMAQVELGKLHLRIARPSDNLDSLVKFYRDGLGFTVLHEFTDHDGFDGVMLGHQGADYHLEFTRKHGHKAGKAPTEDNLLVFYLPDAADWKRAVDQMKRHGHRPVKSFNPYWDKNGKTFEDPDGYRVVLQHALWPG